MEAKIDIALVQYAIYGTVLCDKKKYETNCDWVWMANFACKVVALLWSHRGYAELYNLHDIICFHYFHKLLFLPMSSFINASVM